MSAARALYGRFRQLIHEFAKFGVIGVIGLLITNGGYDLLHYDFGIGPLSATTVATIVATAVAFVGNRYWTFRHRERTSMARESVVFFILNGLGLLIQDAAVGFNYYVVGLHGKASGFVALNVGIAIATLFRFWSYRKWVWLGAPAGEPAPASRTLASRMLAFWAPQKRVSARHAAGRVGEVSQTNGHRAGRREARTPSRVG